MRGLRWAGRSIILFLCILGIWSGSRAESLPPEPSGETASPSVPESTCPAESPTFLRQKGCIDGLPCRIPDTPLTAQALIQYEGPFLEDGTDNHTVCAALILTNTSRFPIEYTRVTVTQNGKDMVFEITYLPAGADILVLDKKQSIFSTAPIDSIRCVRLSYCDAVLWDRQVYVSPEGTCGLIATNLTDRTLPTLRILYKHYVPQYNIYIGGITYSAVLTDLYPGESRRICPYRFLSEQSKIIAQLTA